MIKYIEHNEIDKGKWDTCIDKADNGLIYAYSVYLDTMAKHWDALVWNDYEAVMPLTWNKKWGIYYLYQPFLMASLGVFGKGVNKEMVISFLKEIPAKFSYWDIYLNHGNWFSLPGFNLYERTNYVLDLAVSYDKLAENFRPSYRQLLKKTEAAVQVKKDISLEDILLLTQPALKQVSKASRSDYSNFLNLYSILRSEKRATTYGVYTSDNKLVASGVFLFSHNRAYYILAGNHPEGRNLAASHHVLDAFIKDHAGKGIVLDFEGSDIETIAFFFKGFGAIEEKYVGLRYNKLPLFLKIIKR